VSSVDLRLASRPPEDGRQSGQPVPSPVEGPWDTDLLRRLLASVVLRSLQDLSSHSPRGPRRARALRYLSSPAAIQDIAAATGLPPDVVAERLPAVIDHCQQTPITTTSDGTYYDYDALIPPALRRPDPD
jgi:hypothetical protein